ncbi:hypothetical protein BURKHO8Y_450021 [Burkholderia sp. 8Y]|nr:hypothetical protein BURKHO8Y_450021 [Burkholderia sp. 8Y]
MQDGRQNLQVSVINAKRPCYTVCRLCYPAPLAKFSFQKTETQLVRIYDAWSNAAGLWMVVKDARNRASFGKTEVGRFVPMVTISKGCHASF